MSNIDELCRKATNKIFQPDYATSRLVVASILREHFAPAFEAKDAEIGELIAELRECAMATGETTGDFDTDANSLVEPVMCAPLEIANLVTERISDRDIQIAALRARVAELEGLLRDMSHVPWKQSIRNRINAALSGND